MPAMAKEFVMNLPWGALMQAAVVLLMMQAQLPWMSSPLAAAWLCVAMDGGHAWLLWAGLTAGAWLCGGAWWWVFPAAAALMITARAVICKGGRCGGAGAEALLMAGMLALGDAVARTGADPAHVVQWLACALAAVAAAIPFLALQRSLRGQALSAAVTRQTGTSPPVRMRQRALRAADGAKNEAFFRRYAQRASVGLAENIAAAHTSRQKGAAAVVGGTVNSKSRVRRRECPGADENKTADCPTAGIPVDRELPGREQARRAAFGNAGAALLGRMVVAMGASAGTAAAFGGESGVLMAAAALAGWQERYADVLAALLAAVLAASGVPPEAAATVMVLWVSLRLLEKWPRPVQAAGSLAGAGTWLVVSGMAQALGYLFALTPATVLILLLPERRTPAEAAVALQAQRIRMQRRAGEQLNALADVLADMAQGHGSGLDPPREDELLVSLRARLCDGCVRYERCWNGRAGEGLRLLCELITKSVNGTLPERVLPDMMRRCMRANLIPNRLYAELNRFAQARSAQIARMDGAQRARLTIDTAVRQLRSMAEAQEEAGQQTDLRLLEAALRYGGLTGVSPALSPGGVVLSRAGGWPPEACERARRICGRVLGARYATEFCDGPALGLRPAPTLVARTGWDGVPAEGDHSGDSVYIGALDDRRQLVVISDGMGTGEAAAGESRRAVTAVRRFLQAGIPPERAALLANQLLMSEGSGEMFATLDLCVIDNWRMEAIWVKMAACDSFLLREHTGMVISGGRLPMGILAEAAPRVIVQRLLPGDVIIMGTDGAMEGLDVDTAQRCLIARRGVDAMRLARALRQAGESRRMHTDDQTLVVVCMEKAKTSGVEDTCDAR